MPALVNDFSNPDVKVRSFILQSLAQFESNAIGSISIVTSALKDPDNNVSGSAAYAFKRIDPVAAAKAGVK